MTWSAIAPPASTPGVKRIPPATVAVIVGRFDKPAMIIRLRADAVPETWRKGTMLEAASGTGEHAGLLRLSASGIAAFELQLHPKSKRIFRVRLPLPEGLSKDKRLPQPVDATKEGAAVILTLPEWARPRPSAPAPASTNTPQSVTARLMGDPPPERSAARRK